jgi:ABC-type multidrug transport system ATPase subunit
MSNTLLGAPAQPDDDANPSARLATRGLGIDAEGVSLAWPGGDVALRAVDLHISPGRLVAIAGRSGTGKTTLLEVLAGLRPVTAGALRHGGDDGQSVGFVPQDDIIHRDLPVRAVVRYAARLRLPSGTGAEVIDGRVDEILLALGLDGLADRRVGALSGGQRKRVSIGVELLARPGALFLDEPTSGLDPVTADSLMTTLRGLAECGTTVVMTTHSPEDVRRCDELVFVVPGGTIAFHGAVDEAPRHFGVTRTSEIYAAATGTDSTAPPSSAAGRRPRARREQHGVAVSRRSQFATLTARNVELLRRNRLSTAIMLGSPALVVAMFVVLFQPGAAERGGPTSASATMTSFWMAFAAFFFGLTFGLLQVCTELAIVRRERFVGVRHLPYLAAKVAVLAPVLLLVVGAMVVVLRVFDRTPELTLASTSSLVITLHLASIAALALGLLASSLVREPGQATLALPMLCFPAVLFAGCLLPVGDMPDVGRAISVITVNRWAYEAVSADLAPSLGGGPAGPRLALVAFAVVLLLATGAALHLRTRQGASTR